MIHIYAMIVGQLPPFVVRLIAIKEGPDEIVHGRMRTLTMEILLSWLTA
jgi:hypothetical protein